MKPQVPKCRLSLTNSNLRTKYFRGLQHCRLTPGFSINGFVVGFEVAKMVDADELISQGRLTI